MDPSRLRKRQIADRLGVSEQVLDQYLQLKRAEVLQPRPLQPRHSGSGGVPPVEPIAVAPDADPSARRSGGSPVATGRTSTRWSRRLQPEAMGLGREPRTD